MDQSDIRVVVADERFLFRKGVRALLGQVAGIRVIEEASSAEGVLGAVETHAPDLLLLDSALSGSGLDLVKAVRGAQPHTRVLLMLAPDEFQPSELAEAAGVTACLPKGSASETLVPTIRKLGSPHGNSRFVLGRTGNAASGEALRKSLTPREQEVLDRLMRGETSRDIATLLGLSLKTVDAHKFNLMRKLDVHNRGDLIKLAIREQISSYTAEQETW